MSGNNLEDKLQNISPIAQDGEGNFLVKAKDWFYLTEEVERVQELENQRKEDLHDFVNGIVRQNKRYREGLEIIKRYAQPGERNNFRIFQLVSRLLEGDPHESS